MKKIFLLIMVAAILLSGCVDKTVKVVKIGDNISVDYIGSYEDGKVFDTSIESVAQANNLPPRDIYEPLNFTVGKKPSEVIEGFDEGVIGMKVGETRTLTIPPEKGYGLSKPELINVFPIVQVIPSTTEMPKEIEIPVSQFETVVGPGHKTGETVEIPDTNINLTILNITISDVSLSYKLKVGDVIWSKGAPWNETVIKIDNKNITTKPNLIKNEIIQFPDAPFNTTVVDITETNITLRNNPIPDTTITVPGIFGQMVNVRISFNETSVIMDQNPEVAGKTLIFNVTLLSIDK
ncbi:MAG: FKBP-type peptidyl-prolyl cis-trans isomerase [Candidatus Methanoperedens sp.]|nr:FKBP-type peptidyl-prolyl cis-trans isomerase [Candidatus Methanoperedens sp.]